MLSYVVFTYRTHTHLDYIGVITEKLVAKIRVLELYFPYLDFILKRILESIVLLVCKIILNIKI